MSNLPDIPVTATNLPEWVRRAATAINLLRRDIKGEITRVDDMASAVEQMGGKGFGFVDYSDNNIGTATALPAGQSTQVTRTLTASPANQRLQGVFEGHQFWDNATSTIRVRQLFDTMDISIAIQVAPGASGGVLDVTLMAGSIEVGSKSFEMTGPVGVAKGIRADFKVAVRNSFFANGAKVMLTPTVTTDLLEFSPEFYPTGYET